MNIICGGSSSSGGPTSTNEFAGTYIGTGGGVQYLLTALRVQLLVPIV